MFNKSSKILIKGVKAGQIRYFSSFQAPKPEQNPMNAEAKQQKLGNLLKFQNLKNFFHFEDNQVFDIQNQSKLDVPENPKELGEQKREHKGIFQNNFFNFKYFLKKLKKVKII